MKSFVKRILNGERQMVQGYCRAVISSPNNNIKSSFKSFYTKKRMRIMRILINRASLWVGDSLVAVMCLALKEGDVFVDAGANIGDYSYRAAALVGSRGMVHSFEPSPTTAKLLRKWIKTLGLKNVKINELALGNKPGFVTIHEFAENYGGANSLKDEAWPGHEPISQSQVAMVTIDDYVEQNNIGPIRLMKLDVQGSERDILLGASRTITGTDQPPVLFVELEECCCSAFGYSINDLLIMIRGLGYMTYSWRSEGMVEVSGEKDLPDGTTHDDVICLKPGYHDELLNKLRGLSGRQGAVMAGADDGKIS